MKLSKFGTRFSSHSGIVQLMEDLGEALAGPGETLMLGGGNPAHIPQVQQFLRDRMQRLVDDPAEFGHMVGDYDPPRGEVRFVKALAELLNREYGWNIGPENIALTAGSQTGFFVLFNMFAGEFDGGQRKRILLPLIPEYIGYANIGLSDGLFEATRPAIDVLDDHTFKYRVDFDRVSVNESIGALCVSRPTNPTGNVLTDTEIEKLLALASAGGVPLIIDNAYGKPFPNIVFTDTTLNWSENVVLCMSLSKLGLPGVRTGIIIARPEITTAVMRINAMVSLAAGSVGPDLVLDLVRSGEVLNLSNQVIRPYYRSRAEQAIAYFHKELEGLDYYLHKAEGALFLWLWLPGLPISSEELYQRLKQRGVLVVPGHYFFPGLVEDWIHRHECLRVSYAMPDEMVRRGIGIIGEEVRKAFA